MTLLEALEKLTNPGKPLSQDDCEAIADLIMDLRGEIEELINGGEG